MKTLLRIARLAALFSAVLGGVGCNLFTEPSENTDCLRAGRYRYAHHISLEDDPATFPDGSELRTVTGLTWVEWRNDRFYFSGGEFDAWAVEGTCDGNDRAFVSITLHNACANGRQSHADSHAQIDWAITPPVIINSYHIEWTCGGDPRYMALERWDLFPAYEPPGAEQPPAQCAGTRVGEYCWYLGAKGQSCDEVCAPHGGYHDATRFYAGSTGTNAQCTNVLNALGAPSGAAGLRTDDISAGGCCYLDFPDEDLEPPDMRVRYLMATTASARAGLMSRACACQQ